MTDPTPTPIEPQIIPMGPNAPRKRQDEACLAPPARLMVIEKIYHAITNQQPVGEEHNFSVPLTTDEQPYYRVCQAKSEWTILDVGWMEGKTCSLLMIQNTEGKNLATNQREEFQQRILEVGLMTAEGIFPLTNLPPGESMRLRPKDVSLYLIRSAHLVRFNVKIYPG